MANKIPKTDLEDFRRELEEDIRNFNREAAVKEVKQASSQSSSRHSSSSHHSHSGSSSGHSGSSTRPSSRHSSSHHSSSSHRSSHSHHKQKHGKKPVKIICAILAIVLLLGAGGYGFLQWELNRINRSSTDEVTTKEVNDHIDTEDLYGMGSSDAEMISDPNITNILLVGQDREKGDKAEMRSDAMIICSINSKTKEITLCSLMRDMYVPVPDLGYGMLNHTYMIGGFDLLEKTIESNFGIPIDGNIEVDFQRFMQLIDIMGGVNVNITAEEAAYMNKRYSSWNLKAGENRLTAEQALYYCRIRENIGGDWGRTDRQRKVIMSAFNQLKSSGAKTLLNFAHDAMPALTTNLTNTKIIKYAYALASYSMDSSHSYRIPEEGTYTQEVREETLHVLIPDLKKNSKLIKEHLYKY